MNPVKHVPISTTKSDLWTTKSSHGPWHCERWFYHQQHPRLRYPLHILYTKTELFLLSWSFSDDGYPIPVDDSTHRLTFTKSPTDTATIQFSAVSNAYKTLGFNLCMNQDNHTQFKKLQDKSHNMANGTCGSSCNHCEAFLCYFAMYYPSISYVLPLTTFFEQQCTMISAKPNQLFLQKCGFALSTPRSIVYASCKSGGLAFWHLYTKQGIAHVEL